MKKYNKDILLYIETEVQFDSLKPFLVYLRDDKKISYDIVVPRAASADTMADRAVFEGCAKALSREGFSVTRSVDGAILPEKITDTRYQLLLSAYMHHWHYKNIDVKYRVMFPYASYYLNKPHWTIKQFVSQDYLADALLSHAVGTKPVMDIFTNTHIVPSLKLMGYRKKAKRSKKPVLFFAPTYNEMDFAVNILQNIDEVKKKYSVIMRGHPKTSYADGDQDVFARLSRAVDKVYDVDECSIVKPLQEADIVLSDNSAVIFDAIYCGVPVALFSQDPNSFNYKGIDTIQSQLVESGDILWTDDPSRIRQNLDKTMTAKMLDKQRTLQRTLFPQERTDPVGQWMDVLSIYLEDRLPVEYSPSKKYWVESITNQVESNRTLHAEIENLNRQIQDRDAVIVSEQNTGIYVSTKRLIKALLRKVYFKPRQRVEHFSQRAKHTLRLPYRKFRIKVLKDPIVIYQFMFTEPDSINFGDELTKDIIERLFHKKTEVHNEIDTRFDMLGVGSLLHFFNDVVDYRTYVWGSGLIDDEVEHMNDNFIFKACRGKYTRAKVAKKYQNIPMGDPGLLSNLIYTNKVKKTDKIGVIPHLRSQESRYLNDIIKKHPEIFKVIPVAQPPEKVADEIKSCKLILSSSLHGLIVADSFGVPNMHLLLSDNLKSPNHLRGGEYKFRDYCSGVGRKYANFNPEQRDLLDIDGHEAIIRDYKPLKNLESIQKSLIKSFPY